LATCEEKFEYSDSESLPGSLSAVNDLELQLEVILLAQ
jgi:hypothetical protein